MADYLAVIEFEDSKILSRRPEGREYVDVKTSVVKSDKFDGCYESANIRFTCPFTGKNVSLELGLANHGKNKAIRRIVRTINSYLDAEEARIRKKRYDSILYKNF